MDANRLHRRSFCLYLSALLALLLLAPPAASYAGTVTAPPEKATGALTVKINPKAAKQAGARWRVDNGTWQKSGRTVSGLGTGSHEVTFKAIDGWKAPKPKTATINADVTTVLSGKYAPVTNTQTVLLPGGVPLELVWIPPGSFMMGRYASESNSYPSEDPQHQVTFANGFWIGKYEVTQAQWVAVMGSNPSYFTGDLNRPVEEVSWNNVQDFIAAVNALGQGAFRLPSEAQWEYACRAGTTTRFYWGDDPTLSQTDSYTWHTGNAGMTTNPVGQKLPNAWGLFDMGGNVWEWCEDYWHADYTGAPTDGSAWLSGASNSNRVTRGGAWYSYDYVCRSAYRNYQGPTNTVNGVGFRIAK